MTFSTWIFFGFLLNILQSGGQPLVRLPQHQRTLDSEVTSQLLVFEDTSRYLSVDDLLTQSNQYQFTDLGERLYQPKKTSNYWSKLQIKGASVPHDSLALCIGDIKSPDFLEAYVIRQNKVDYKVIGGVLTPYSLLSVKTRYASVIPLSIDSSEQVTVFLRIQSTSGRDINLCTKLQAYEKIMASHNTWLYFQLFYQGALMTLVLYNLIVFLITRDKTYFLYSVYLFLTSWLYFSVLGLADITLFRETPSKTIHFGIFSHDLNFIFYFLFTQSFLNAKVLFPTIYKWINRLVFINIAFLCGDLISLSLFDNYTFISFSAATLFLIELTIGFVIVTKVIKSQVTAAYYYSAGISILIVGSIIGLTLFFSGNKLGMIVPQVASLIEFMSFSIALAFLSNQNEREKRLAKEEVIEKLKENERLQQRYAYDLELQVITRTEEINQQKEVILAKNILLEKNNKEKEIMLAEIHHRVKNNLQFISSMLNMQARRLIDRTARISVREGRDRVKAMALVHQKLYEEETFDAVLMKNYINTLVRNILSSYSDEYLPLNTSLTVNDVKMDFERAVLIGLIINELVSNAIKYAFVNSPNPVLRISMKQKNGHIVLDIADNGRGLPAGFELDKNSSFGLKLVRSCVADLDATFTIKSAQGARFVVRIPYPENYE
ncbi:MAG: histidine kinase dimerization/phosphoacceptor domain -containing protein [Imperialibacter sp.]|uniref:histidine kinase dimerization/phosphoacceptor domain -containing protein n=1 Tax=Imperialibacter sp. TaxID=2038411 RepID=UPI0032EB8341